MTSHMLCLEDTILHKLLVANRASRSLKTTQETISQLSDHGHLTIRTLCMMVNHWRHPSLEMSIQLLSIQVVRSLLSHQINTPNWKRNGTKTSKISIAKRIKHSAKVKDHVTLLPSKLSQYHSLLVKPILSCLQRPISIKERVFANLQSLKTLLMSIIMVTSFLDSYFWSISTRSTIMTLRWSL